MQGLQVPTWLAVVLLLSGPAGTAFGAIFGQWLGQKTAAKRDDARWEREREREDLRHDRELAGIKSQREQEIQLAWRSERLSIYAGFLESYNQWSRTIHLIDLVNIDEPEHLVTRQDEFSERLNELFRKSESLELVGSAAVRGHLESMMKIIAELSYYFRKAKDGARLSVTVKTPKDRSLLEIDRLRGCIRDAARADLLSDPIITSRSSVQLS